MSGGGSKKGERRGGRQKGTPNKKTKEEREAMRAMVTEIIGTDGDPKKVFIDILKSPDSPSDWKFKAAEIMMPYIYPKLASIEQREGGQSHEERLKEYQKALAEDEKPMVLEEVIEIETVPMIEDKTDGDR